MGLTLFYMPFYLASALSAQNHQLSTTSTAMQDYHFSDSPLHMAILNSDIPGLCSLFENRSTLPDLEERSRSMTALQAAGHYGTYETIPILLTNGADVNAEPGAFGCALQAVISSAFYQGMGDLFFRRDVDKHASKQREQANAIRMFLEAGADVNRQGGELGSPLAAAAAFGLEDVVGELLGRGASPDSPGGRLGTALTAACARGGMPVEWMVSLAEPEAYGRIAKRFIRAGATVDAVGGIYGTALQAAASVGEAGIVDMLLGEGKADPNVRGGKNGSALGAAAEAGHPAIVDSLLRAGAEVGPTKYISSAEDDWDTWREQPVGSVFPIYGKPLPNIRIASLADRAGQERIDDPVRYAREQEHYEIVSKLEGE